MSWRAGEAHSVREFVEKAFACTGRKIVWQSNGESESGVETGTGRVLIEVDPDISVRPR
jgi:GDPmannose 4,6-dehydratase